MMNMQNNCLNLERFSRVEIGKLQRRQKETQVDPKVHLKNIFFLLVLLRKYHSMSLKHRSVTKARERTQSDGEEGLENTMC